jgi:hypothetical protein
LADGGDYAERIAPLKSPDLEQFSSGALLPIPHGAPLRLRFERQLGYKMAKYVMRIEAMDGSPAWRRGGFWEDRGVICVASPPLECGGDGVGRQ